MDYFAVHRVGGVAHATTGYEATAFGPSAHRMVIVRRRIVFSRTVAISAKPKLLNTFIKIY